MLINRCPETSQFENTKISLNNKKWRLHLKRADNSCIMLRDINFYLAISYGLKSALLACRGTLKNALLAFCRAFKSALLACCHTKCPFPGNFTMPFLASGGNTREIYSDQLYCDGLSGLCCLSVAGESC